MEPKYNIVKGTRVRARWFDAKLVSLAGVTPKVEATLREVIGAVRHIRGDDPVNPKEIHVFIESDDGLGVACGKCQVREIEVDAKHIVEILG